MRNLFCSIALALLLSASAAAQVPLPGQGTNVSRNPVPGARFPRFQFHSNFWMNLHHFLYHQARLRLVSDEGAPNSPSVAGLARNLEPVKVEELSADEQKAWNEALDYYASNLAGRDLLFNGDMVNIKNRLSEWEKQPDLSLSGLRAELITAMTKAAPIYRVRWWPAHDKKNREWIDAVEPRIASMGEEVGIRLATTYQSLWPGDIITVDVTYYANWAGAYTSDLPLHITVASSDSRNQGETGFEILYHEASHGLTRHVRDAIARECRSRDKPIPRDLWHAVLFFTTGEMVKRSLTGRPGSGGNYVPYAYRYGLFDQSWPQFRPLLERYWRPYIEGRLDFDSAIARIVSNL